MDAKARAIIANLPAVEPAIGKDGPLMGADAATAISEALQSAGYEVLHKDSLWMLRDGMISVLAMMDKKRVH
jgi:hypothetical protein